MSRKLTEDMVPEYMRHGRAMALAWSRSAGFKQSSGGRDGPAMLAERAHKQIAEAKRLLGWLPPDDTDIGL